LAPLAARCLLMGPGRTDITAQEREHP